MSKIGLYADPHFSVTSSIITGKVGKFSKRLQNLIDSFKWMNELFEQNNCSDIFCLGDMTDKPSLTAEEITALSECNIENHHLIVGNHCRSDKSGEINSLSIFKKIYYEPVTLNRDNRSILILPYNSTLLDLKKFKDIDIILSHNDIKGYDFGGHISDFGYSLEDILNSCKLFINGHLHNGSWLVKDRALNLGILTGINFSNCNGSWNPSVAILDTETLKIDLYENPIAFKFKKISVPSIPKLKEYLDTLNGVNYVLQVKIPEKDTKTARKLLDQTTFICASRILSIYDNKDIVKQSDNIEIEQQQSIYVKLKEYRKKTLSPDANIDMQRVLNLIEDLEKNSGGI